MLKDTFVLIATQSLQEFLNKKHEAKISVKLKLRLSSAKIESEIETETKRSLMKLRVLMNDLRIRI